jgi:hypothetical protein
MSIASKLERCRAHEATEGWKREGERQEEEEPRADLARNGERGCVRLATKLSRGAPPFSPLAGGEAKRRATGHPDDADTEAPRGSREPASPPRRIAKDKINNFFAARWWRGEAKGRGTPRRRHRSTPELAGASESAEEDRRRQNTLHARKRQQDDSAPRSSLQHPLELNAERGLSQIEMIICKLI